MGRLHPVAVFVAFTIVSVAVFFSRNAAYQLAIFGLALVSLVVCNRRAGSVRFLLLVSLRVFLYVGMFYAFLSQVAGSRTLVHWPWGFSITDKTLVAAVGIGARLSSLLLYTGACFGVISPSSLARGANQVGVPYSLSFVVLLASQVFERFIADWDLVTDGLRSRGVVVGRKAFGRQGIRALQYGTSAFILLTLRQISDIDISAELRGLGEGLVHRTHMVSYRWRLADSATVACAAAISGTALWLVLRWGLW
jgi:energy-coupling factor transporter transmembrane protein EcfT